MNSLSRKLTVLVCSCDAYDDLWEPFFRLFFKYWKDCPCDIVLNTEKKYFNNNCVRTMNYYNNDGLYGKRIKECLKKIETEYVLLMLDDFFLRDYVDSEKILKIIECMDSNKDISCVDFNKWNVDKYNENSARIDDFVIRSKYGQYRYNMQIGIWRRLDLYNAWKDKESPWQWELYGNFRSFNNKIYTIKKDSISPFIYRPNSEYGGVYRGKWVMDDVKDLFSCLSFKLN